MSKIGIGIGVKIADIKKVKEDLNKQINNIKGIKVTVSNIKFDEKLSKKIQDKLNSLAKSISLNLKNINIDEQAKEKLVKQLQNQINKITKETKINLKDVDINDKFKDNLQSKLNKTMNGMVVKINKIDFSEANVDGIANTAKGATKAFDELKKRTNEVKANIDGLSKTTIYNDENGNVAKAMISYSNGVNKVTTETLGWKKVTDDSGKVVDQVFTKLGTKTTEDVKKLDELKLKVESIKNGMNNQVDKAEMFGIDGNVLSKFRSEINGLNVNNISKQGDSLKQKINATCQDGLKNITLLQNSINSLTSRINNIKIQKANIIDKNEISELKNAEEHVEKLQRLSKDVKSGKIIDGGLISSEVNVARNSVNELSQAIRKTEIEGKKINSVFKNLATYAFGASSLYFALDQLKTGLTSVKEIDSALRDLKRVVDDVGDGITDKQLDSFPSKANEVAKSLGSTTEEAIRATTVWKQMGYSFKEASEFLSKQSLVLGNVGDMSADDATNSLVSTLKAFKIEARDTGSVVDSLNEAGNKFALTTGDLAEGLRIGASSLALANNDLYESESLIIAGTEVNIMASLFK